MSLLRTSITHSKLLGLSLMLLLAACGGRTVKNGESSPVREFPQVSVPSVCSQNPGEYALTHFWDGFFAASAPWRNDTSFLQGVAKEDVELNMAMFARLLSVQPVAVGDEAMKIFFGQVEAFRKDSVQTFVSEKMIELTDKYLYDPASPLRNEDAYYEFARGLAGSPIVAESMREHYRQAAYNCSLNRKGTKAADFTFKDKNGVRRNLYGVKARYTLVKIQDMGCTACKELKEAMDASPKICDLLKRGVVAEIDVPAEGEIEKVYDVRAIPSLYILDENKIVLAKDAEQDVVLEFLENINE